MPPSLNEAFPEMQNFFGAQTNPIQDSTYTWIHVHNVESFPWEIKKLNSVLEGTHTEAYLLTRQLTTLSKGNISTVCTNRTIFCSYFQLIKFLVKSCQVNEWILFQLRRFIHCFPYCVRYIESAYITVNCSYHIGSHSDKEEIWLGIRKNFF